MRLLAWKQVKVMIAAMVISPERLLRWFLIAEPKLFPRPGKIFADEAQARNMPISRRDLDSLKTAVNETLTMAEHGSWRNIVAVDEALRAEGLPSFDEMRALLSRNEARILRRGRIRNNEEYHIAKELLSDGGSDLRPSQLKKLNQFVSEYEKRSSAERA